MMKDWQKQYLDYIRKIAVSELIDEAIEAHASYHYKPNDEEKWRYLECKMLLMEKCEKE